MNKKSISLMATVGMLIGGSVPLLFGDGDFDGWSILGGLVGGIAGIWLAVKIAKRFG